jgi:Putative zinc-finger
MSAHPSPEALERLWARDLPPEETDQVGAHAAECPSCKSYLDGLAAEDNSLLAALPPGAFVEQLERRIGAEERRRRLRRYVAGVAVTTLVAAALLLVPRPAPERFKGGEVAALVVHRKRDEQVRRIETGMGIRAGDSLRVSVTLSRPAPAGVWFVDADGRVDALPGGGLVDLRAGEQTLPGTVVVDSPCVSLWVVAASGPPAAGLEQALRRSLAGGAPGSDSWLPPGAVARRLECE